MWTKAMENAKLIISTILLMSSLAVGSWTLITNTFITRIEAAEQMAKYSIEIAYNKAFRLETKIDRILAIEGKRELSDTEKREIKRLKEHLKQVDNYISAAELKMFSSHDE